MTSVDKFAVYVVSCFVIKCSLILGTVGVWLIGLYLAGTSRVPFSCMEMMIDVFYWNQKIPNWAATLNMVADSNNLSISLGVKITEGNH